MIFLSKLPRDGNINTHMRYVSFGISRHCREKWREVNEQTTHVPPGNTSSAHPKPQLTIPTNTSSLPSSFSPRLINLINKKRQEMVFSCCQLYLSQKYVVYSYTHLRSARVTLTCIRFISTCTQHIPCNGPIHTG